MIRLKRLLHLLALLTLSVCPASPQSLTGFPPFGTFTNPAESINIADLNIHISVPVVTKAGRIPFSAAITYDGANALTVDNFALYAGSGWQKVWIGLFGELYMNYIPQLCTLRNGTEYTWDEYDIVGYIDTSGTLHPMQARISNASDFGVPTTCHTQPHDSATASSTDGSGYSLSASIDGQGKVTATVYSPDGDVIVPTDVNGHPLGSKAQRTDRNGNQITASGGSYLYSPSVTDTLNTTVVSATSNYGQPLTFTYTNPQGGSSTFTVNWGSYTVKTNFQCQYLGDIGPLTNAQFVNSISLPDGSSYSFTYEPTPDPNYPNAVTGRIASVTFPTGGTVSYQYTGPNNGFNCNDGTPMGFNRTTADGTISYGRYSVGNNYSSNVSDSQGNAIYYYFSNNYENTRNYYIGNTIAATTYTCYNIGASSCTGNTATLPITQKTTVTVWANGQQNRVDTYFNSTGQPIETDESDYGNGSPGPPLRKTVTTYASLGNNILDKPSSAQILDGGGNQVALTNYSYDETSVNGQSGLVASGAPQLASISGSRGNLTTISKWLSTGGSLNTTMAYDDTGNVLSVVDPNGQGNPAVHSVEFQYSNADAYVSQVKMRTTGTTQHITSATYDSNTGLVSSTTDQNGGVTNYGYDCMLRLIKVGFPDGGEIDTGYSSSPNPTNPPCVSVTSPYIEVKQQQTSGIWTDQYTYLDGLGRTKQTRLVDPEGDDYVDTSYDAWGHVYSVSNPYRTGVSPKTYYAFDSLNRLMQVTNPDGSIVTVNYQGRAAQLLDEGNGASRVQRISQTDGLGRVVYVCEVSSATQMGSDGAPTPCDNLDYQNVTGFKTTYQYDALTICSLSIRAAWFSALSLTIRCRDYCALVTLRSDS